VPITCGSTIRLQNMVTHTNLHSERVLSQRNMQMEVSHYGISGHGTAEDNWQVECEPATTHAYASNWKEFRLDKELHQTRLQYVLKSADKFWSQSTVFRLKHSSGNYLNFASDDLAPVCGDVCASRGTKLVTALQYDAEKDTPSYDTKLPKQAPNCVSDVSMKTTMHVAPLTHCIPNGMTGQSGGHIVPVGRDSTRFFAKFSEHVAFEANPNSELLLKRMLHLHRRVRRKDFIAWRSDGSVPCEPNGKIIVGQVSQVFEEAQLVIAEEWVQVDGFYHELPRYYETMSRKNWTLPLERIYGPLLSAIEKTKQDTMVRISLEFATEHQPDRRHDRGGDLMSHAGTSGSLSDFSRDWVN